MISNPCPPILYEDGRMKRDYVHVHDVARANLLVMEKEEADYQVYNVGSGIPTTQREFAAALARKLRKGRMCSRRNELPLKSG